MRQADRESGIRAARRERAQRRAWVEGLLARAEHLPDPDRRLVEQVYRLGQPLSHLALATGTPRARLQRRLARVLRRIRHPMFSFTALQPDAIPDELRPLARMRYIQGLSLRAIAQRTGRSLHAVRMDTATLQTICRLHGGGSS